MSKSTAISLTRGIAALTATLLFTLVLKSPVLVSWTGLAAVGLGLLIWLAMDVWYEAFIYGAYMMAIGCLIMGAAVCAEMGAFFLIAAAAALIYAAVVTVAMVKYVTLGPS